MRQERRKKITREKILEAAKQVFLENGIASTNIADIVKKSKLARGTFYIYFQSTEQVINALLQDVFVDIQHHLGTFQVESLDQKDFTPALRNVAGSLLKVFEAHRDTVRLLLTTMTAEPQFRAQTIWFQEIIQTTIRVMLDRGVSSGRLRRHDTELMSSLVSGGLREVLYQWLVYDRFKGQIHKKVDEMISIYMNGVELEG